MATTQYQVLARYYNTHTNNAVTNDSDNAYQKTFQFYTEDASSEIAEIIMEGNNPQNVKNDMLFAYAGTKKVFPTDGSAEYATNKLFMEEEIVNLTQENKELSNSITVCTNKINEADKQLNAGNSSSAAYLENKYKTEYDGFKADYDKYTSLKDSLIDTDGNFKPLSQWRAAHANNLLEFSWSQYNSYYYTPYTYVYAPSSTSYGRLDITTQYGRIPSTSSGNLTNEDIDAWGETASGASYKNAIMNRINLIIQSLNSKMTNAYALYESNRAAKAQAAADKEVETNNKIKLQQLVSNNTAKINEYTVLLTEKGEAKFDAKHQWPYMIIDVYERVWFSPWFSVHVCGSLNSALEKAKVIVSAIGIDNVKIIKLVNLDQFIRIR
jgi:hypothetical protein